MTEQAVSDKFGFLVEAPGQVAGLTFTDHALRVSGEIDMNSADELEAALIAAFEPGEPLRVDMSGVTFMDSTGIRAFLVASQTRDITIVKAAKRVRAVFEITGLAAMFHLA